MRIQERRIMFKLIDCPMTLQNPPRRAKTRCRTLPGLTLYSLMVLSSAICFPPKIKRCCGGGMPKFTRQWLLLIRSIMDFTFFLFDTFFDAFDFICSIDIHFDFFTRQCFHFDHHLGCLMKISPESRHCESQRQCSNKRDRIELRPSTRNISIRSISLESWWVFIGLAIRNSFLLHSSVDSSITIFYRWKSFSHSQSFWKNSCHRFLFVLPTDVLRCPWVLIENTREHAWPTTNPVYLAEDHNSTPSLNKANDHCALLYDHAKRSHVNLVLVDKRRLWCVIILDLMIEHELLIR